MPENVTHSASFASPRRFNARASAIPRTSSTLEQSLAHPTSPAFPRSQSSLAQTLSTNPNPALPRSQSTPSTSKPAGDFRTIVSVYDQPRSADIVTVFNTRSGATIEKMDTITETSKSLEDLDVDEKEIYVEFEYCFTA